VRRIPRVFSALQFELAAVYSLCAGAPAGICSFAKRYQWNFAGQRRIRRPSMLWRPLTLTAHAFHCRPHRPASGPISTFAFHRSGQFANVEIKGPLEDIDSSGALDLTFASRDRGYQGSERQIRSTSAHAGGALGHDRRLRGHCGVPGLVRVRLRHRCGDPRRRRLFDHGVKRSSAHFPKFVIHCRKHFHELRKVMGTSKSMILVPLSIRSP
jgi:hypothetical protein